MYEKLTAFFPKFSSENYGEWIFDQENDGSEEHPIHLPFVAYDDTVTEFVKVVYDFVNNHEEMNLREYHYILEIAGIKGNKKIDILSLDGQVVMALILNAIRTDRFCEGFLLEFFQSGKLKKCLLRLKILDEECA